MKRLLILASLIFVGLTACGAPVDSTPSSSPKACNMSNATSVQTETKSDGSTVTIAVCG